MTFGAFLLVIYTFIHDKDRHKKRKANTHDRQTDRQTDRHIAPTERIRVYNNHITQNYYYIYRNRARSTQTINMYQYVHGLENDQNDETMFNFNN